MTCASAIKQTSNFSFCLFHYNYFVISRITSKLFFLFLRNVDGINMGLIGAVARISMSNSSQLHLLNEHGNLSFSLHISDHYIVGNNQGKFK